MTLVLVALILITVAVTVGPAATITGTEAINTGDDDTGSRPAHRSRGPPSRAAAGVTGRRARRPLNPSPIRPRP